ncbi:unnamed protein product, partial [Discosporangium mesarthrocarpum]
EVTGVYEAVGFPGAVSSTDVTHVRWERAPISYSVHYTGKEGYETVAYEVTVDHTQKSRSGDCWASQRRTTSKSSNTMAASRQPGMT